MSNLSGKPILILKQNTERLKGRNALSINIEAIKTVAESIRTTLGPKGLNKMIVDSMNEVTVTGDGAKILEELSVENPAAKMVVDLSKTIHKKVGDGASSTVIFLGELMKRTSEMISVDISPTLIYEGYIHALKEIKRLLKILSMKIEKNDYETLNKVAITTLNTKNLFGATSYFANMIVECISNITEMRGNIPYVDLDNIQIIKKEGDGLSNSQLIRGIIVDKEVVSPIMPKYIKNAKIALIDGALEIIKTDFSSEIQISNPDEISGFLKQEENLIKDLVNALISAGVNVVFCQKGIDEMAQHYLAKSNIIAVRRVKHSDMVKLSRATGANIITRIKSIQSNDLGNAKMVSEQKIGKDNMIFVEECKDPKSLTILIRGGTELIVDDAERALKNGLGVVKSVIENLEIVGGAGSIEIELRRNLHLFAQKMGGKEQIAIENYADALEIIPKTIIENSGKDSLDFITNLRAKIDYSKKKYYGFDSNSGEIVNTHEFGIIESTSVKTEIYSLATEMAISFIRIDDYIRSSRKK